MTFREFITTSPDDADPRRARFARANVSLVGLAIATVGLVVARLVDGPFLVVFTAVVLADIAATVVILGISYAVFRRGGSGPEGPETRESRPSAAAVQSDR